MILIYCPTTLGTAVERDLEQALERDGARVHYVGSDGADEYVIVESSHFEHTRKVERRHGLTLAWQESRGDDTLEAMLSAPRLPRKKKSDGRHRK